MPLPGERGEWMLGGTCRSAMVVCCLLILSQRPPPTPGSTLGLVSVLGLAFLGAG